MNTSNAAVIKILTDMGLRDESPLTPEQEQIFKQATDPHEDYYSRIERLFVDSEQ